MYFDGFIEQDYPFVCPECGEMLDLSHCIGTGEYPINSFRSRLDKFEALGFECPCCFAKSVMHSTPKLVEQYNEYNS